MKGEDAAVIPEQVSAFWPLLALLGAGLLSAGCRSQHPDSVQISPAPAAAPSQVEPPASRLAGASGSTSQSAAPQSSGAPQSAAPAGATASFSDSSPLVSDGAQLSGSDQEALMEAFQNASPEVRELAAQRFAALQAQAKAGSGDSAAAVSAEKPAADAAESSASKPTAATASAALAATDDPALPTLDEAKEAEAKTANTSAEQAGAVAQTASTSGGDGKDEGVDIRHAVGDLSAKNEAAKSGDAAAADEPDAAEGDRSESAKASPPADAASKVADASASDADRSGNADPLAAVSDEQLFEQLIARYQNRVTPEEGGEVATGDLITLRTLTMLAGNPDGAVTPVEGWNQSEQEFLNYQMLALWQLVDPQAHPVRGRRWAMALPELRQATSHLAASTGNLDVRGLAFCTEVESYGRIKPFPNDRFTAGQQVILYSELENFVAERLSDGYETHLRGTYEIFDAAGQRVADQVLPEDRQICNNYRRDYFIAYQLYLPNRLAPGSYRLALTMEDLKGKKYGQSSIPLEIIAK